LPLQPAELHRNINLFPFRYYPTRGKSKLLGRDLGLANSRTITVRVKTFSASIHKVLICVFATTTKICTSGSSIPPHGETSQLPLHPSTLKDSISPLRMVSAPSYNALSGNGKGQQGRARNRRVRMRNSAAHEINLIRDRLVQAAGQLCALILGQT
jgi:hypothetical protein